MTTNVAHPAVVALDDCRAVLWHSLVPLAPQCVDFGRRERLSRFVEALDAGVIPHTGIADVDEILTASSGGDRCDPEDFDAVGRLRSLSLVVAESCNLGCDYCIAGTMLEASRARGGSRMGQDVASASLSWFADATGAAGGDGAGAHISFSGGEPLLNWPVVSAGLAAVRREPRLRQARISISTNASLITPEIAGVLAEHGVSIGTSLDGVPGASDRVRTVRGSGQGASAAILAGWRTLLDAGCKLEGFLATFNDRNVDALDTSIIDFAEEWGFRWVRVEYDVVHLSRCDVRDAVERIWNVYTEGRRRGIVVDGFWSNAAHSLLAGRRDVVPRFCGAVSGVGVSVHPDGRVSSCGYSSARLGTVTSDGVVLDAGAFKQLISSYMPGRRPECRGCDIEGFCAGGCNISQEYSRSTGSRAAIEFNCALYQELTGRIVAMAAGSN